ncbi:MAG: 2OG-Fe(II) oxygenase family protein [Pseudohongiella sp.]
MNIQLNPGFDAALVKQKYQMDNRVRVHSFLDAEDASLLLQTLARETEFASAFNIDGANGSLSDKEMRQLAPAQIDELQQKIYQNAGEGAGFLYGRHDITGRSSAPGPARLRAFADILNSETLLDAVRHISGHDDISCASAQATRYLSGNFLTRHNDYHPDEGRLVAYVMNLSPEWHPDWGGLLQFYEQDGTPRDAWTPQFNTLTLFDVSHVHAVTFVAPYAKVPRFAITGWFRTKAL